MKTTYLDTIHFDTYVAATSGRAGVRVVWDNPGSVPRTDGKTLYIPRITSTDSPSFLNDLRYYIKHETSHILYTDFKYFHDKGTVGLLQYICNVLEDNRIDYLNDSEYVGDVRLSQAFSDTYQAKVQSIINKGELSDQTELLAPLFMWEAAHRGWIMGWDGITPMLERAYAASTDVNSRYRALMSGAYGVRLESLRTSDKGGTDDLLALAEDILRDIYAQDPEEQKQPPSEEDSSGKGKGKGGGDPSDEEGEGQGEGDDVDRLINVSALAKELGADHLQPTRTGLHMEHEVGHGGYTVPTSKEYHVYRWPLKDSPAGYAGYFKQAKVNEEINNHAKPLSARLRHKLQVRARGRYEYGVKSGKLHTGSLHRLVSGRNTEAESRVFRRHVTSDTLDTAVSLLVDCSGSMSGDKFETACAAAASLALALKPLHISFNVLGFTNQCTNGDPMIWVFNDWSERVTQAELVKRFSTASACLWENTDGDAIAWANNYLTQRREKRKLLIVLSDGAPAGRGHAGSITRYTKDVVESIEARKEVEIYGVGIMDNNVKHYYKNNVVIKNTAELASSLLSIIDKAI